MPHDRRRPNANDSSLGDADGSPAVAGSGASEDNVAVPDSSTPRTEPQRRRRRRPRKRRSAQPRIDRFRSLYFGMAAAEAEVARDADRFRETYFDPWNLATEIEQARRFLILGPKGAGKSAVARYLELRWRATLGDHAVFSNFVDFDELNRTQTPLVSLDKKLVGDVPALVDSAWRLFLGVRLLESLTSDPACDLANEPRVTSFIKSLADAGLASTDYPQVLRKVRERKGTLSVPGGWFSGGQGSTETDEISVTQVGEALLRLVERSRTPNRHLLVIDGLDKAIGNHPAYWGTLASLVRVTDAFERRAREAGAGHVTLLVLCRSDVFRRVRFADAAKIAADAGFHLEWGAERADPRSVLLWDYIASKAQISTTELFKMLPAEVPVGERAGGGRQPIPVDTYLLQFTRYTPRDMTLLFNSLQQASIGRPRFGADIARGGADSFARRNFVAEVASEAHGLLPATVVEQFDSIISALPLRVVTAANLRQALIEAGVETDIGVQDFGEYLFLQGALGNYLEEPEYVQFYHRRDTYKFQRSGPWVLHTALVYAYNLPWARPRPAPRSRSPRAKPTR